MSFHFDLFLFLHFLLSGCCLFPKYFGPIQTRTTTEVNLTAPSLRPCKGQPTRRLEQSPLNQLQSTGHERALPIALRLPTKRQGGKDKTKKPKGGKSKIQEEENEISPIKLKKG